MFLEESLDQVEVEDVLEHLKVVLGRVNDLNLNWPVGLLANGGEVDVWNIGDFVRGQGLGGFEDFVSDRLRSRRAVRKVVLDSKILSRTLYRGLASSIRRAVKLSTPWVVTGCEKDTAGGFHLANDVARCGCTHDAILTEDKLLDTVCRTDLNDQLHDLGIPVSAISTNDQEAAVDSLWNGEQDAGDEGFAVVFTLEGLDLLAETGRARLLVRERLEFDCLY